MNLQIDSGVFQVSVLMITVVSTLWLIWKSITKSYKPMKLPPGPRGLPIVGYLPFIREDLHTQFTEQAQKYGPMYKLWLGNKLCVVVSSPSLIKELLRDHDTVFANRDKSVAASIATYNANDIVWCPYGPEWCDRRKLFVSEMMSTSSLKASYNLRRDEVRRCVRHVYSKAGRQLDICELSFMVDVNVVMSMVWGSTVQREEQDKVATAFLPVFAAIFDGIAKPNISDFFPILARFDIQGIEKEMKGLMERVICIMEEIIDDRIKRSSSNKTEKLGQTDFLQMILDLKDNDDVKVTLNRTQTIAMLTNIIVAATDTSATLVEWTMAELLNNPEAMEKVQKELAEVVGVNNIVEEDHIHKLVYLDAAIKEAMRLHPIGPFLTPRTPSRDCTVAGYNIPKDSGVYINVFSVQRDPLVFDNPSEFKPERFLVDTGKWDYRGNDFNYLPFGSGRRICPGIPLADRMSKYVLGSLLHSFDWQLPQGENFDMLDKFGIVLRKRTPLHAIPVPRLSDLSLYA